MNRKALNIIALMILTYATISCEDITEPLLDGKKVELVAPISGVISTDSHQQLYWNYIDAKAEYELQVVSPRFDSIVKMTMDTVINKNTFPITLEPGEYEWRVRALNNSSVSPYSDSWKLSILENGDSDQ